MAGSSTIEELPPQHHQVFIKASSVDPLKNIDSTTSAGGEKDKTFEKDKTTGDKLDLCKIRSHLGIIIAFFLLLFLCLKLVVHPTRPLLGDGGVAIDGIVVDKPKVVEYISPERTKITIEKDSDFLTGKDGAKPVRYFSSSDAKTNADLLNRTLTNSPMYCEVKPPQIQVFINFREIQICKDLVRYLMDALQRREFNASVDNHEQIDRIVDTPKVVEYISAVRTEVAIDKDSDFPTSKYGAKPMRSSSDAKMNDRTLTNFPVEGIVKQPQIQVFINFRGVKLHNNFGRYLVHALRTTEVIVYIDNHEKRGEDLNSLVKTIEDSGIDIVVFSTRYTGSKRCLEELVKIKDCVNQGLLKVTPTNVQSIRKGFALLANEEYIRGWEEAIVLECIPAERAENPRDEDSDLPTDKYGSMPVRSSSSSSDAKTTTDLLDRTLINSPMYCKVKPPQILEDKTSGIKQCSNDVGEKLDLRNIRSLLVMIIGCLLLTIFCLHYFADKNKPLLRESGGATDRMVPQIQVFINFRGDQLRNYFVGYLVHALQKREVNVFIDNHERRGEDLDTLYERIEDSGIAIVVFSTRYTESNWCLDELVKIKECVQQGLLKVIPIFYKVSPTDVKRLKGEFGDNFRDQEHRYGYDSPLIKAWKEAIVFVTQKHALVFDGKSGALEVDFVESIVKEVLEMLHSISKVESGQSSR